MSCCRAVTGVYGVSELLARRGFVQASGLLGVGLLTGAVAGCTGGEGPRTSETGVAAQPQATAAPPGVDLAAIALPALTRYAKKRLNRLMAGNHRFATSRMTHADQTPARVKAVAQKQKPFAVVLACADSRVSPEVIFDQGLGDLFVLRVAGNILDDAILGSIEYGVEHLGAPLIMVLGHERCGAVSATVDSVKTQSKPTDHVLSLVDALSPVVTAVMAQNKPAADLVENVVAANARWTAHQILDRSGTLHELQTEGHVGIVAGRYDLDQGLVTVLH
jgi:carbonic anhydrase